MVSNFSKKSNLLTSVAVIFSLLAITAEPVEARRTSAKSARVFKARGDRVSKARGARVSRARKARTSKVRAARVSKVRGGRVHCARAGGNTPLIQQQRHAAAALRHQAIAARQHRPAVAARHQARAAQHIAAAALAQQQAIAQQQAQALAQQQALAAQLRQQREVARQAAVRQAMQALPNLPFVKQNRQRTCFDNMGAVYQENFELCDLGYTGPARTAQYQDPINPGNTLNVMNIPTAPVLHPYNPADGLNTRLGPVYSVNVKLPGYLPESVPANIQNNLAGVAPENIEHYFVVMDNPWQGEILQVKPQSWLEPNAPTVSAVAYGTGTPEETARHLYTVRAGVFSRQHPNVRIQGQPNGGLLLEPRISVHNGGPNTRLVSSGPVLSIENLNPNVSQVLNTLTRHVDKVTGIERAAISTIVLLNQDDQDVLTPILAASNNLDDLGNNIRLVKNAGLGFADLDLADIF